MKKLLIFLVILVAAGVGAVISASLFLDKAIINGAETFGPKLTGGPVTIQKVNLNILSGSGEIGGVTIGNPKGFATDAAIKLKTVQIAIEPKSLLSNRIRIKNILIDGPEITYETSLKGTNINKIMTNIQTATGGNARANDTEASKQDQPGKQLLIDDLQIRNGKIRMSATMLKGKALDLTLPDIHLRDIGKKSNGASMEEVAKQVFTELNKGVATAVGKSTELLGETAKDLQETGKKALGSATEGVKNIFKGLGNAITGGN
ncbi:MAG: AsmA family protein [Desulfobulbaceae bacterium]|nr:AsmA family protein [Desulfobulbaceae bacterium]